MFIQTDMFYLGIHLFELHEDVMSFLVTRNKLLLKVIMNPANSGQLANSLGGRWSSMKIEWKYLILTNFLTK